MQSLRVHLLGGLELYREDWALPRLPTRRATALFSYIALHYGRVCPREGLIRALWPDLPDASGRKQLRNELWRLRDFFVRHLPELGCPFDLDHGWVRFVPGERVWLDLAELETLVRNSEEPVDGGHLVRGLERAAALYRGDLLSGQDEDWCYAPRERLRQLHLGALERLFDLHLQAESYRPAVAVAQRLLAVDPLVEHVEQRLLLCLWKMGDRPRALREFETFKTNLRRELAVGPSSATLALYRQIQETDSTETPRAAPSRTENLEAIASMLEQLAGSLDLLRQQIRTVLETDDDLHPPGAKTHETLSRRP